MIVGEIKSFTLAEKMKLRAELDDLQAFRRRNITKRDRLVAKARLITARATRCRAKVLTILKTGVNLN
jgi:hypothetical protein